MLKIIGAAVGSGGPDKHAAEGPDIIQQSPLWNKAFSIEWIKTFRETQQPTKLDTLIPLFEQLAQQVKTCVENKEKFCVIGGDHSAAIGTWSGASEGLKKPLGLIWIDAHKDAHTFETSPSMNIHGMPVATLLGHGNKRLTHILSQHPKILPENLCLIGVRSFEEGEHKLLESLNIKTYDIKTVQDCGIEIILKKAREHVTRNTAGYGITCDLDAMDPQDIPGVSTPESNGINAQEFLRALTKLYPDPLQIGFEIMEFNPSQDKNHKTEEFIFNLLEIIAQGVKS